MFRAEKERCFKCILERCELFNVPETIVLCYNGLIPELCRSQKPGRQGAYAFIPTMAKLLLSITLLSCAPLCVAETRQQGKPEVKAAAKQDEALVRAHKSRMSEIAASERAGGDAAVAFLKKLQADADPLVRGEATAALGRTKAPSAFAALSEAVRSTDTHIRRGAIQGLAELKDKRAVPALITALGHAERDTRWKAAEALGVLKDARAADALIKAARMDKDRNVRLAAIAALVDIGGAKAAAAMAGLKNDADPEVKAWAAAAEGRLKKK